MPVVTDHLAAEYLLREGSGTTTFDTSGNGYNGTFDTTAPAWNANGLSYTSSSDRVILPDATLANDNTSITDATLDIWVQPSSLTDTDFIVDLVGGGFSISQNSLGFTGHVFTSSFSSFTLDSSNVLTTGVWVNIIFVRSADELKIYVNGTADTASSGNPADPIYLTFSFGNKVLGGDATNSDDSFLGVLGEARIYSKALSAAEVAQNYTARVGSYAFGPSLTFSSNLGVVTAGESFTLSWTWSGATDFFIDVMGDFFSAGSSSSFTTRCYTTQTYVATATNSFGSTSVSVTVTVSDPVSVPPDGLTLTPNILFFYDGDLVYLTWSPGNANTVFIDHGFGYQPISERLFPSASVTISSTTTFTLTAANGAGSATISATVYYVGGPPGIVTAYMELATIGALGIGGTGGYINRSIPGGLEQGLTTDISYPAGTYPGSGDFYNDFLYGATANVTRSTWIASTVLRGIADLTTIVDNTQMPGPDFATVSGLLGWKFFIGIPQGQNNQLIIYRMYFDIYTGPSEMSSPAQYWENTTRYRATSVVTGSVVTAGVAMLTPPAIGSEFINLAALTSGGGQATLGSNIDLTTTPPVAGFVEILLTNFVPFGLLKNYASGPGGAVGGPAGVLGNYAM